MSRAVADSPADLGRLRVGARAVFAAFVIHNVEEAATIGWFLDRSAADRTPFVGPPVMRVLLGGWSAIAGRTRLG